ncbi:MAG: AAA family ATPase [Pseudomonadota bacterium]
MIIIVFGLAAAGKTYVGKFLNKHYGFHHEDGDHWLSTDMQQYVHEKKLFTMDMLEDFTVNMIANIEKLKENHNYLVITQALYRKKNRDTIKSYFESKNEKVIFLQVEADDEVIYKRLVDRGDWVFPEYAASMRQFFESMETAQVIYNNEDGEENISKQIKALELIIESA